ncbi:MAG: peptidylprolyl isomerase [Candidatus Omnitrophica bacterium]|nr:peptidylprolyl isomerase [Candidatus Omnitrophota bacterium]
MAKRYFITILITALAIVSAGGCAKKPSADDTVLVNIGNYTITLHDFKDRISKLPVHYRNMVESNKLRYLEEIIAEKLFYEEAVRDGLNNDKEIAEIIKEAKKKLVIAKLIKARIDDKVTVGEDEIRAFYEENKDKMRTPEMWRASHILVMNEAEAQEILQALKNGAKFDELASARSKDATASRGGDVGYFKRGQLVPEFEKEALKLNTGDMSDVVHTKFGYHIIKLTDKKEAGIQAYEKAKPLIENELKKKKKATMFDDLVEALKKKYGVSVNEKAIDAISPNKEDRTGGDQT